jgi:hypothetical protein
MLVKRRPRAVWIGSRGGDAACVTDAVELRGVVCCDWSAELAGLAAAAPVASIERDGGERLGWVNADLGRHRPETIGALLAGARTGGAGPLLVLCYSAQPVIETAVVALGAPGVALVAPAAKTVQRLADKRVQRALFRALGVRTPAPWLVSAGELRSGATGSFAPPAVLQPCRGTRGLDVHRFERWGDAARIAARWPDDAPLLVSPWIEGVSLNVNAVVGRNELHVAWPSVQVLAPPGCCDADWPLAYCGNDYAAAADLPPRAHAELCDTLERLAPALRREGFLGMFGADWVWDGDALWLLELNLRFQGSTPLLSQLEREAGVAPLVHAHLEAFAPGFDPGAALPPARPERALRGAQVLVYQSEPAPRVLRCAPSHAPGFDLREAPVAGTSVHPRALLCRLVTRERALDASLVALAPAARAAVDAANAGLAWEPS